MRRGINFSLFLPEDSVSVVEIENPMDGMDLTEVKDEVYRWNRDALAPSEYTMSCGAVLRFVRMEIDDIGQNYLIYRINVAV